MRRKSLVWGKISSLTQKLRLINRVKIIIPKINFYSQKKQIMTSTIKRDDSKIDFITKWLVLTPRWEKEAFLNPKITNYLRKHLDINELIVTHGYYYYGTRQHGCGVVTTVFTNWMRKRNIIYTYPTMHLTQSYYLNCKDPINKKEMRLWWVDGLKAKNGKVLAKIFESIDETKYNEKFIDEVYRFLHREFHDLISFEGDLEDELKQSEYVNWGQLLRDLDEQDELDGSGRLP